MIIARLFDYMVQFDIITIFPETLDSYFQESILKRAQKKKLIKIKVHDLRKYAKDKHKTVDDRPYGGGPGMIFKADIVNKAVEKIARKGSRVILFSAKGKKFNQKKAEKLRKYKQIVLICGRYEGVDERVAKFVADEELSIGDYVLTGGEIPAMVVIDTVSRLIPGVIRKESLKEESFSGESLEYPQYTRPEVVEINGKKRRVPKVLLSGNHKKIEEWKKKKRVES